MGCPIDCACKVHADVTSVSDLEPTYVCADETCATHRPRRTFERRRMRVYVAGPISKGDTFENIIAGLRWGKRMLADGLAPYIPHLDAYLTLSAGNETPGDEMWKWLLEWDLEWVASSEAIFRIDGESKGADLECDVAGGLSIPVFTEDRYDALLQYAGDLELRGRQQ